jgi:hypothetical protein
MQKKPLLPLKNKLYDENHKEVAIIKDNKYSTVLSNAPAMLAAIKVVLFTKGSRDYLIQNDPQALKQLLSCLTLGDIDNEAQIEALRPAMAAIKNLP